MGRRFDRIGWALAQDLTSPKKFVLVVLADAANENDGICWLKRSTLAERTGLSMTAVKDALRYLHTEEYIRVGDRTDKAGRQTSNYYQLGCYEPTNDVEWRGAEDDPQGGVSRPGEGSSADRSIVNQPEGTDQANQRKKTSSSPSSRTRGSRQDDGPDQSKLDALHDELRPGTRPQPAEQTRRVTRSRKSPTPHIHEPMRRNAGGLACYWGRALEAVDSLEPMEETIVGRFFKLWLERGLDVRLARKMIDLFFADPELVGSTHRWKRFVSNAETIRQRVLVDHGVVTPGVDATDDFDWVAHLPSHLRAALDVA